MVEPAALYVRVSTQDQDLEGQERELRAYARVHQWNVVQIYREKASATGRKDREQYGQLLHDSVMPGRPWNHLLVWSMDRFSREERFTRAIENIWQLEQHGIRFHSLKEPAIDTPEDGQEDIGRTILRAILPIIASFESKRRSERVRLALSEIRAGRRPSKSPIGRPRKVTLVKVQTASMLRQQGMAWKDIARRVGLPAETCRKSVREYKREGSDEKKKRAV